MLAFDMPLGWDDPAADAKRAEEEGMDGLWSLEAGHDPYLPLALAAGSTERVVLGSGIAVAFPRTPLVHAQTGWDLQRLSRGRAVIGLGAQVKAHNQRRYSGPFDHPVARMQDMVLAIRAIWASWQDGTPLDYRGEFYQHTLMTPFFNPGPQDFPAPPIYVAAVSEPMLRMAGAVADGIHIHPLHSPHSLDQLTIPVARGAATEAGRDGDALVLVAPAMIATGRTMDEAQGAREGMRAQIAFYGSTPAYHAVLDVHGKRDVGEQLHAASRRGAWGEMPALVDDELLDAICATATWDGMAAELHRRYSGRVQRVMPYTMGDTTTPWATIAREVREAG
jgi:probable F420-dependent oxidoreductase